MKSEEEMANLHRLSNDYVPEAQVHRRCIWVPKLSNTLGQGALVGHLQSTQALAAEYAHADPVYVHKTAVRSRYRLADLGRILIDSITGRGYTRSILIIERSKEMAIAAGEV